MSLLVLLLAGCLGDGGGGAEAVSPDADVPELVATPSTGVIRAVVVDEAIRPVANARVEVTQGAAKVRESTTGETGFAGFEGLAPGTYFLMVSKAGFFDVQQAVEVVAGVSDPSVAKVQLVADVGNVPFYQEFNLEGFLECSAAVGNWCFIANYYPCVAMQLAGQPCTGNLTNDNSYFVIDEALRGLQRVPDWMQVEMVWQSTQALGGEMNFRIDFLSGDSVTIDNATGVTGPSPLLLSVNATALEENEVGTTRFIALETFHGGATGAAIEQRFTYFVHVFYGYQPPEGWRFSAEGTAPPPP